MARARQDASYAAQLIHEIPEGDEAPLDSTLSVQRRTFYIEKFSLDLWESLVEESPVNVFLGEDYLDLSWDDEDDDAFEDDDEDEEEDCDQAMELDPGLIIELAGWLRSIRFEEVYDELPEIGEQPCYQAMDRLHEVTDDLERQVFDEVATLLNVDVDVRWPARLSATVRS
ncbi:hypothetical protein [Nonomuraea sp. B1E8]|uniref:hypothetical protein n=1 Tax=unclassified Nonomuraea TaxID=2593643 RepID=UPI00325C7136